MSITSYAQNFEDVMLWRALQHVQNGCYIDIGAQDPLVDSVSLAFHQQGWYGVHVEPTPHYAELLRQQRPGDTVVQAAVSNGPGLLQFFEIANTGISTGDPVIAEEHRARGFKIHEITVPCITLAAIFDAAAGREIHWLKVDVEGFEQQVLASWAPSTVRPWVVVVESTRPLTQIESYDAWEPLLVGYGYTQVYFDGLNRYYIADAHAELKEAFRSPPNVFDEFRLNGTASNLIHTLIVARHQEQIAKINDKAKQQKESAVHDVKRLSQDLAELERAKITQHHFYTQQFESLKQGLTQQRHEHEQREHLLEEKNGRVKLEQQTLILTLTQREHETSSRLLRLQVKAAEDLLALANDHHRQIQALQLKQSDREDALRLQLGKSQEELRFQEQQRREREHEFSAQSLAMQMQAANELAALLTAQRDQELFLRSEYEKREKKINNEIIRIREMAYTEALKKESAHLDRVLSIQKTGFENEFKLTAEINANQKIIFDLNDKIKDELIKNKELISAYKILEDEYIKIKDSICWKIFKPILFIFKILPNKNISMIEDISQSNMLSEGSSMTASNMNFKSISPKMAINLKNLMQQQDHLFIDSAYLAILRRESDFDGRNYYLNRLRSGIPKIQIIEQLVSSSEAKSSGTDLSDYQKAIKKYKLTQTPLIGGLFKIFNESEGGSSFEMRLRSIEQQLFIIGEKLEGRLDRIDENIATLQRVTINQTQSIIEKANFSKSENDEFLPNTNNTTEEPEYFIASNKISNQAIEIFKKLKSSIDKKIIKKALN